MNKLALRAAVMLVASLSACSFAFKDKISDSALDYNLAIERSQNEMLLLNIVRASKRRPMYFTSISALRGSLQTSVSTGAVTVPFGGGSASGYSAMPTASYPTNPTFDVAVLDSKTFTQGMLTPVMLDTLKYYWDQGWPKELVLHMLISVIEINGQKVYNNPADEQALQDFQYVLRAIFQCTETEVSGGCELLQSKADIVDEDDYIGPPIAADKPPSLDSLVAMDKAELRLLQEDDKPIYHLAPKKSFHIELSRGQTSKSVRAVLAKFHSSMCTGEHAVCEFKIYIRSPEGILRYLGEILSLQESNPGRGPRLHLCGTAPEDRALLFAGRKVRLDDTGAVVSVLYDEARYVIPGDINDLPPCRQPQSMTALSFVSHLIGLHKEVADLPATGVVNVISPPLAR